MIEEEIPAALAGERLDRIVSLITSCSRSDAAEPALAKKVAVAKRRPTATLAPSSSISAPLAPPAPQHVSEEEFTW